MNQCALVDCIECICCLWYGVECDCGSGEVEEEEYEVAGGLGLGEEKGGWVEFCCLGVGMWSCVVGMCGLSGILGPFLR